MSPSSSTRGSPAPEGGLAAGIDRYFGVRDSGSTIGTELHGGLTTFATMAYIVMGLDRLAEIGSSSSRRRTGGSRGWWRRGITAPIIGPRTIGHLDDLLPVGNMQLSDDVRRACDELVPPGGMVANFHNSAGWGAQSQTLGVLDTD